MKHERDKTWFRAEEKTHSRSDYVRPEEAIRGIPESGGIPALAHPAFGSGDERIVGREMGRRLRRLIGYRLQAVEGFCSSFSTKLIGETLAFAEGFGPYVTAGSDDHGRNKVIPLGETDLNPEQAVPEGLKRFLERFDVALRRIREYFFAFQQRTRVFRWICQRISTDCITAVSGPWRIPGISFGNTGSRVSTKQMKQGTNWKKPWQVIRWTT